MQKKAFERCVALYCDVCVVLYCFVFTWMALHHAHHTSQLYKVVTPETACVDATIWFGLKVQKSCHMDAERIGHEVRFVATAATTAAVWDNIAVSPEQRKDEHLFQRATRTGERVRRCAGALPLLAPCLFHVSEPFLGGLKPAPAVHVQHVGLPSSCGVRHLREQTCLIIRRRLGARILARARICPVCSGAHGSQRSRRDASPGNDSRNNKQSSSRRLKVPSARSWNRGVRRDVQAAMAALEVTTCGTVAVRPNSRRLHARGKPP